MCVECGQTRHPGACPNAPEPARAGFCAVCGEPVYAWEERYDFGGALTHGDCAPQFILRYRQAPDTNGGE